MRKVIATVLTALSLGIVSLSGNALAATSAKPVMQTVTIASCAVSTTQSGVPASCNTPSGRYAERVSSFQVHVTASPSDQAVSSVYLAVSCNGPSKRPVPSSLEQISYKNAGSTPYASMILPVPFHKFCTAQAGAAVPEGSIHVTITAVIVKGSKHSSG